MLSFDGGAPCPTIPVGVTIPAIGIAVLQKIYGGEQTDEKRYSPAVSLGCEVTEITGNPDPKLISTSYVERQNLTMRMSMRRFTRLTNPLSKKVENHAAAVALYLMYYNFGRVHQTRDALDGSWRCDSRLDH